MSAQPPVDPAIYPNPVYKVRDRVTGLWSAGGIDARFTKKGKVWTGRGPLLLHLAQYLCKRYLGQHGRVSEYEYINKIGETWDVVEYAEGRANVYPARLYVESNSPAYKDWVADRIKRESEPRHVPEVECAACRGRGRVAAA